MKNALLTGLLAAGSSLLWTCAQPPHPVEEVEETSPPAGDTGSLTVTGQVTIRRLDGEVEPLDEGTLHLELVVRTERANPDRPDRPIRGTSQRSLNVPVGEGYFAIEVPAETQAITVDRFTSLQLRGLIDPPRTSIDPGAEAIALAAVEIAPTRLRVYGGDEEQSLTTGVRVVHLTRGEARRYGRDAGLSRRSTRYRAGRPISLWPTDLQQLDYLVHAPGFAWTPVTLDPRGGERGLFLTPAGNLEVETPRQEPWDKVLRLRSPDGKLHSEGSIGRHRFTGLPVGSWIVSAEGSRVEAPRVFGRATVEVIAGETTKLSLPLDPLPTVEELTCVAGTVVLPAEWVLPDPELVIENVDPKSATPQRTLTPAELEPLVGRTDAFRFQAGGLEPGRYRLKVVDSSLQTFFEVPHSPEVDLLLELPYGTMVKIAFVDATDGSPVEPRALIWKIEGPGEWYGASDSKPLPIPRVAPGTFEGRIASGRVNLVCWGAPRYETWSEIVDLPAEGLTRRVELVRRTGLVVSFCGPGADSNRRHQLRVEAVQAPDGGRVNQTGSLFDELFFQATRPGTYLLRFTLPPGFAAIPDQEVVIESGALTPLELMLE